MKNLLIPFVFLMMVVESGCITAQRCAEKFPESTNVITTFIDTTIITTSKSFDTIISVLNRDTIFIVDKNTDVRVKVVRLPGDSIFIQPECPSDTIVVTKWKTETTTQRIIHLMKNDGIFGFLAIALFLIFLIAISKLIDSIKR